VEAVAIPNRVRRPFRELQKRRGLQAERRAADEELIASILPTTRLAWRALELTSVDHRLAVARDLTNAVHDADGNHLPGASPLNRAAVRSARSQLLALASRLADVEKPVLPRGVLLADRLVSDTHSPLYDRARADRARHQAERALQALERRAKA
jgi:hypothetical protein